MEIAAGAATGLWWYIGAMATLFLTEATAIGVALLLLRYCNRQRCHPDFPSQTCDRFGDWPCAGFTTRR